MVRSSVAAALAVLILCAGLAACNEQTAQAICPQIRSYPKADLDQALREYRALPPGSKLKQMIGDYQTLRDEVRACRS